MSFGKALWEAAKKWAGADGTWNSVGKGLGNVKKSHNEFIDTFDVMKNAPDERYDGNTYGLDRDKTYRDDYGNLIYYDGYDWRKRRKN